MKAQKLFDETLQTGRELATKGRLMAEEKLGIPREGEQRKVVLSSMGKGAVVGGALALMLGTRSGRILTAGAFKLGVVVVVGVLAWNVYQNRQPK